MCRDELLYTGLYIYKKRQGVSTNDTMADLSMAGDASPARSLELPDDARSNGQVPNYILALVCRNCRNSRASHPMTRSAGHSICDR